LAAVLAAGLAVLDAGGCLDAGALEAVDATLPPVVDAGYEYRIKMRTRTFLNHALSEPLLREICAANE
jgi:hypothetical protein